MATSIRMKVLRALMHEGERVLPGKEITVAAESVLDCLGRAVLVDDTDLQRVAAASRQREIRFAADARGGVGRIGPSAWPK
jgi:hypothetical protein